MAKTAPGMQDEPTPDQPTEELAPITQTELRYEEIALRAYEIYLESGSEDGNDVDNWLQAERELRGASNSPE